MTGRIYIAPGAYHMTVVPSGGIYKVKCEKGEKVNGHCPSVDVLMHSVAQNVGANAVGVMLIGMGHDGSDGIKTRAERLLPIDEIAPAVMKLLS